MPWTVEFRQDIEWDGVDYGSDIIGTVCSKQNDGLSEFRVRTRSDDERKDQIMFKHTLHLLNLYFHPSAVNDIVDTSKYAKTRYMPLIFDDFSPVTGDERVGADVGRIHDEASVGVK